MQRLERERALEYEFVVQPPKLEVLPGEVFVVETEDAMGGSLTRASDLPTADALGERMLRDEFNPCAGPIAVKGARPGDVLVVHVHDIQVEAQGVTCLFENAGPLGDSAKYPECRGPFTAIIDHLPGDREQSGGTGRYGNSVQWKLAPHIGTIGVAPLRPIAAGADSNLGQGPWGGNLDSRDICAGSSILLPIAVDDAYLYLGDVHSSMADGEYFGAGVETRATVTLSCEVRTLGKALPFVRVERPDALIQLNSARPLEAAVDDAFRWMLDWLVEDHRMPPRDAYTLLGIHPEVRINVYQMVRLSRMSYTVGVAFPRSALGGSAA